MKSNALFSLHHTHYIRYLIYSVWCHIHSVCYITQWLYLWHQTLCLWHIQLIWPHAQCYDHTSIVCLHSHYAWHYTQCLFDMTHNVPILWKEVNVYHHSLYMYDPICTIYDIKPYMFMTNSLYMASRTVLWPHNSCVPSQPLCLTLHWVYFWHDTKCTNFMKRSECLSSQPLYVWHDMHYIWHHIHSLWHHTTLFMT